MRTFKDFIVCEANREIPWFNSLRIDDIDKAIQMKEYGHYDDRYIKLKVNEKQLKDILKKLGLNKLKTNKGFMTDETVYFDENGEEIARFFKNGGFEKYDYNYREKYKNDLSYALINGKDFMKNHKTPLMLKELERSKEFNKKIEEWERKHPGKKWDFDVYFFDPDFD